MIASLENTSFRTFAFILTLAGLVAASTVCAKGVLPKPTPTQPHAPIDFALALQYAQRAALVYESDTAIKQKSPAGTMVSFMVETPGGVKAYIETDDAKKIQWVSVRGTSTLENVKLDVDYNKVVDGRLQIPLHKGFADTALQVYAFAKPLLRPGYEVRVTRPQPGRRGGSDRTDALQGRRGEDRPGDDLRPAEDHEPRGRREVTRTAAALFGERQDLHPRNRIANLPAPAWQMARIHIHRCPFGFFSMLRNY